MNNNIKQMSKHGVYYIDEFHIHIVCSSSYGRGAACFLTTSLKASARAVESTRRRTWPPLSSLALWPRCAYACVCARALVRVQQQLIAIKKANTKTKKLSCCCCYCCKKEGAAAAAAAARGGRELNSCILISARHVRARTNE